MTADQQERPEAPERYRMVAKADGCYEQVAADGEWVRAVECDRLRTRYEEAMAALREVQAAQAAGELSYRTSAGRGYEAMLIVDEVVARHGRTND